MDYPLIGHEPIMQFFDRSIAVGRMSHAYCFVGPERVGKRRVAAQLAAQLLGTTIRELRRNPDYLVLARMRDEKTGKTKKNISLEQLADAASFIRERPFVSKKKVIVVDHAQRMSSSAANALLKTLEEPPAYAHILLITPDDARLPATIRSRCQTIYFHPVPEQTIRAALAGAADYAEEVARLCLGKPGQAIRWLSDPDAYEKYTNEVLRFHALLGASLHEKTAAVESLFGDKSDHIAARDAIRHVLGIWQLLIRDEAYSMAGTADMRVHHLDSVPGWTSAKIDKAYKRIEMAKKRIEENVHPRLLVEHVLLALP